MSFASWKSADLEAERKAHAETKRALEVQRAAYLIEERLKFEALAELDELKAAVKAVLEMLSTQRCDCKVNRVLRDAHGGEGTLCLGCRVRAALTKGEKR